MWAIDNFFTKMKENQPNNSALWTRRTQHAKKKGTCMATNVPICHIPKQHPLPQDACGTTNITFSTRNNKVTS